MCEYVLEVEGRDLWFLSLKRTQLNNLLLFYNICILFTATKVCHSTTQTPVQRLRIKKKKNILNCILVQDLCKYFSSGLWMGLSRDYIKKLFFLTLSKERH